MNTSTKAAYVTQLSDTLIIQLNIFKHIDGISKKFIPNLSIDEEISLWGNRKFCVIILMMKKGAFKKRGQQKKKRKA